MQVNYSQAMHELQSMFGDLGEETIRNVLAKNDGNIEPSIDELLRIQENGGNNNQNFTYDDDNMFAGNSNSNSNNYGNQRNGYPALGDNFGGFGGNNAGSRASNGGFGGHGGNSASPSRDPYGLGGNNFGEIDREEQERIDAEMAYNLQREYMAQDEAVEQQMRNQVNSQQYVQQPGQNRPASAFPNGSNAAVVQAQQEKKKKKGVFSKISGGFKKIFDKKNKKGPTGLSGQYADIDEIGDNEPMYPVGNDNINNNVGNFGNSNANNFGDNSYGNSNNNNFGGNSNSNNFNNNFGSYGNNNNNNARNNHQQQREEEEDAPMQLDDILNQRSLGNNNNRSDNVNANHFGY